MLVLAALGRRAARPALLASRHRISRDRLFEGEALTVTVTISSRRAVSRSSSCWARCRPAPCSGSGRPRALMTLRAGDTVEWSYEVRFPRRGVHDLGAIAVRVRDRLGLRTWEHRHVDPMVVRVYPRIVPLRSLPRPFHTQPSVGDYVSSALGEGIEPGDVRQFAPGDRIKQVNWRASLRLGQLYVTQRHRERNADVVLMLDTLAEVGAPPETTLDQSVRAAASLATAYLARKDRVGLITYGGVMSWVRPGSGAGPVRAPGRRPRCGPTWSSPTWPRICSGCRRGCCRRRRWSSRSPRCSIARFARAVLDLAARGFDLVVLVVSPVAVTRAAIAAVARRRPGRSAVGPRAPARISPSCAATGCRSSSGAPRSRSRRRWWRAPRRRVRLASAG